jgi:bla regulator protein BlaR1
MLLSRTSLEPGIFGIARPVLLWPEQISERLGEAHLEAILAHELWHVRRRDNLAAAIHMVVEAIFWFHPMVWWLGARLVEERERACDEEVLQLVGERQVYAESILKVCEFCVGSPLACISGVTGADLKKRIVHIMSEHVAHRLDLTRKLLLGTAGLVAIGVPIAFGLMNATPSQAQPQNESTSAIPPTYEVVKIKQNKSATGMTQLLTTPDRLSAVGVTLQMVIEHAYGVEGHQITQAPGWLNVEKYDIEAKASGSVADELKALSPDQRNLELRRMLQALLADRFRLSLHRETNELPVYSLVVAENGPKLQEAKPGDTYPNGIRGPDGRPAGPHMEIMQLGSGLTAQALSMAEIAKLLTRELGRTVLDKTGLTGNYDFTLHWTPANQSQSSQAPLFTALQEQLGLRLESQTAPLVVLVIDNAEKPSED